ncbi:hypothetical protein LPY96_00610 (plasmid) [Xanthomonas citri pv. malvacearum]|uniref:hypothetical protein n=1 Tax=Xanthomonas TaxID=338 RepID=UPI001459BF28|nr:hypothetical protein [Xanthomonas citri]MCC4631441.1 hypothetical protein [Xanthomonas citri]NMI15657.1 hypothetical protein [Xanthomonas citri]WAW85077.1 hypothetical protein LPY96_00610 [Xanthomonas citri pv. malvacearum]
MNTDIEYQRYVDAFGPFFDAVRTHVEALPLPEWQRYRTPRPHAPQDGPQLPKNAMREDVLNESAGLLAITRQVLSEDYCDIESDLVPVAVIEDHPVLFSAHYGVYCWFGTDAGWSLTASLTYPASPIDRNGCTCGDPRCHRLRRSPIAEIATLQAGA